MHKAATSLAVVAALLVSGTALADEHEMGEALYSQYCATCHGADGTGAGPLTELLTTQVPDLTGLAAANDGDFPMLDVIHIIDGRTGVRAHGGPMPTYGGIFMTEMQEEIGLMASVLETRGRILSLAMYLESIQE